MPGFALATYPGLLASQFPIVVVGAVGISGIYAQYSQGLAAELTVSAVGNGLCADRRGGASERRGTSYGESLQYKSQLLITLVGMKLLLLLRVSLHISCRSINTEYNF